MNRKHEGRQLTGDQRRPISKAYNERAQHTTPRLRLTTQKRSCPNCASDFLAAWGWLFLPSGRVLDICGACARLWRYCSAEQRRGAINELLARIGAERMAAA